MPASADVPERSSLKTQLLRFLAVGVVSAIVDFGLFVLLMNAAHLTHTPAKALSWCAGTATAYTLNSRWTFEAGHSTKAALSVALLYASTFAVQVGLTALVFPPLEASFGRTVAQVVSFVFAQGVATVTNFVLQRVLIFKEAPGGA